MNLLAALRCTAFKHEGELWAVDVDEGMTVLLLDGPPPSFSLSPLPAEFPDKLARCPPDSAEARLVPMTDPDRFDVAGVSLNPTYVIIVGMLHPTATWRATVWWEPVYAVVDGKVCAMVAATAPPTQGQG